MIDRCYSPFLRSFFCAPMQILAGRDKIVTAGSGAGGDLIRGTSTRDRTLAHADQTTVIQGWIDRLRDGDESARAALLDCAAERLARLARKMLKGYPRVGRWEETDDVMQNALVRLDRALKAVAPPTARDFFRLAAAQVRRELIDLARRYSGPEGLGANHLTHAGSDGPGGSPGDARELSDTTYEPGRLASWTEFHRRIERLPDDEREVFDLLWYQGLTQAEAAAVLGVTERTVNRRWIAARLRLNEALGGQLPV
jgi:RNA polymerase sigma-70 factor (ECF subfamily)